MDAPISGDFFVIFIDFQGDVQPGAQEGWLSP